MTSGSRNTRRRTSVKINYQPIGSGGGVRQFTEGTVDFGASDAPMSDEELAKLKGPAVHIPTVLGADVITYNLPEVTQPLNLTGQLIADILHGQGDQVERAGNRRAQQGRDAAESRTSSSFTAQMAAARRTSSPII